MLGAIRKRDIAAHPIVTVRCFGWHVFLRALAAGRDQTFLSLLATSGAVRPPKARVPELVARCVELELTAKRVYESLADRFADHEAAATFFATLARQERGHAELLDLSRAAVEREGWVEQHFAPWRVAVPQLERQMDQAETRPTTIDELDVALRLVIRIESSELDSIFDGILAASDSEFVDSFWSGCPIWSLCQMLGRDSTMPRVSRLVYFSAKCFRHGLSCVSTATPDRAA